MSLKLLRLLGRHAILTGNHLAVSTALHPRKLVSPFRIHCVCPRFKFGISRIQYRRFATWSQSLGLAACCENDNEIWFSIKRLRISWVTKRLSASQRILFRAVCFVILFRIWRSLIISTCLIQTWPGLLHLNYEGWNFNFGNTPLDWIQELLEWRANAAGRMGPSPTYIHNGAVHHEMGIRSSQLIVSRCRDSV